MAAVNRVYGNPLPLNPGLAAQYAAVAMPILGRINWKEGISLAQVRVIRRLWKNFLERNSGTLREYCSQHAPDHVKMRTGGYPDVYVARKLMLAERCWPPFLHHPKKGPRCGLDGLCPFCWGRSVGDVWDRVADLLHDRDPETGRRSAGGRFDLVLMSRDLVLRGRVADFLSERVRGRTFEAALAVPPRRCELRSLDFEGAYEVVFVRPRIFPDDSERPVRLVGSIRQLFAVPPGSPMEGFCGAPKFPEVRMRRWSLPAIRDTQWAVASLCRYPSELLRVPPGGPAGEQFAAAIRAYVEARRDMRLWASYQGFRRSGGSDVGIAGSKTQEEQLEHGGNYKAALAGNAPSLRPASAASRTDRSLGQVGPDQRGPQGAGMDTRV